MLMTAVRIDAQAEGAPERAAELWEQAEAKSAAGAAAFLDSRFEESCKHFDEAAELYRHALDKAKAAHPVSAPSPGGTPATAGPRDASLSEHTLTSDDATTYAPRPQGGQAAPGAAAAGAAESNKVASNAVRDEAAGEITSGLPRFAVAAGGVVVLALVAGWIFMGSSGPSKSGPVSEETAAKTPATQPAGESPVSENASPQDSAADARAARERAAAEARAAAQAKADADAKAEADLRAKAEADARAAAEAAAQAKAEADARVAAQQKAEADARAVAQQKADADARAAAQAKAAADARAAAQQKADADARALAQQKAEAETRAAAKAKADADARAAAQLKADADARALAQQKAEAETRKAVKAEADARKLAQVDKAFGNDGISRDKGALAKAYASIYIEPADGKRGGGAWGACWRTDRTAARQCAQASCEQQRQSSQKCTEQASSAPGGYCAIARAEGYGVSWGFCNDDPSQTAPGAMTGCTGLARRTFGSSWSASCHIVWSTLR
ncbi:MAG TPA: hypothetical protein VGK20_06495 [Candidatus Binatia bacterium]|jgi:hypothetical protein